MKVSELIGYYDGNADIKLKDARTKETIETSIYKITNSEYEQWHKKQVLAWNILTRENMRQLLSIAVWSEPPFEEPYSIK